MAIGPSCRAISYKAEEVTAKGLSFRGCRGAKIHKFGGYKAFRRHIPNLKLSPEP